MSKLFYLQALESYYNEMEWNCEWRFSDFVENEWEKRDELVEGWSDKNPDKDSLSYYAGVLLGKI
tara:strand:+ start:365 stop:559 length:195 start_codon:yes stop_codon:yes gene_type:complete